MYLIVNVILGTIIEIWLLLSRSDGAMPLKVLKLLINQLW